MAVVTIEATKQRVLASFKAEFGYMDGDVHDLEIDMENLLVDVTVNYKGFLNSYIHYWAKLNRDGSVKKHSWRRSYSENET